MTGTMEWLACVVGAGLRDLQSAYYRGDIIRLPATPLQEGATNFALQRCKPNLSLFVPVETKVHAAVAPVVMFLGSTVLTTRVE
jgi:hypothetical protein